MQENKNANPSVEELICDESFVNYCLNTNSPDYICWSAWLEAHPSHRPVVEEAAKIVILLQDRPSDAEVASARQRLLNTLTIHTSPQVIQELNRFRWTKWVAAAAVFLCMAVTAFYLYRPNTMKPGTPVEQSMVRQVVPAGQVMHLRLKDGTVVDLAAGASLEYPALFNDSARIVALKGDARFDVAHSDNKPFVVRAGDLQVRVLGTTFNVQSFDTDRYARIALFEGRVEVEKGDRLLQVVPGQVLVYDKKKDSFSLSAFDQREEQDRINGLLVFDKATYNEVGQRLAHKYGIEFTPDEAIDIAFSGSIGDESIEQALEKLSFTTNYQFFLKSNTLKVKSK